jgi:hypothetical protein
MSASIPAEDAIKRQRMPGSDAGARRLRRRVRNCHGQCRRVVPLRIGEHVDRDALLAEVGNKRADNQGLVDLRAHLSRARSA